jgi:hypothetical protein
MDHTHAQWTLDVTVSHETGYRHSITAWVLGRRGGWVEVGRWTWEGLGVDADMVREVEARVCSVITEHLVTRYGVQGLLPTTWAGDPGPS